MVKLAGLPILIIVFLLIATCYGQERGIGHRHKNTSCRPIGETGCPQHAFNSSFIRFRGSNDDLVQFNGMLSLLRENCPEYVGEFLCTNYFTECSDEMEIRDSLLPCRSFCESAYSECNAVIESYGFTWPRKLRCKRFPRKKCISPQQQERSVHDDNGVSLYPAVVATTCEPITLPLCQTIAYNLTAFPNVLGHNSQADAGLTINQIVLLVEIGCFDQVAEFFCAVIFPECRADNSSLIMPCRSFCESAKASCGSFLERFGFLWPLSCDRLPTQNCRGPSGFVEVEQQEPDPLPTVESSKNYLDDLTAAVDSLNSHVQKLIAAVPSGVESCHRTAAVKGLEYALKGLQENVEMSSTFLDILEDGA